MLGFALVLSQLPRYVPRLLFSAVFLCWVETNGFTQVIPVPHGLFQGPNLESSGKMDLVKTMRSSPSYGSACSKSRFSH